MRNNGACRGKTLLILTHSFPPMVAASTFRVLRFARLLPQFGWKCVVVSPAESCCALVDHRLTQRIDPATVVHRFKCGDPAEHIKKWLKGSPGHPLATPARTLLRALQKICLPDTRVLSLRRPYGSAADAFRQNPVSAVLVTGPPFSFFEVGLRLKRAFGVPLILDLRDPWTTSPLLYLGRRGWKQGFEERRERRVFEAADRIILNTPMALKEYQEKYPDLSPSTWDMVTNGFDHEDFADVEAEVFPFPTLVHAGKTGRARTARYVIEAMGRLLDQGVIRRDSMRLVLYGSGGSEEPQAVASAGVEGMVEFRGERPHREVLSAVKGASAVLLLVGKGHETSIPGKLYEYLASGRPVIMSGPLECDAAAIVRRTGVGPVLAREDVDGLAEALRTMTESGFDPTHRNETAIREFESGALIARLAGILDAVTTQAHVTTSAGTSPR